MAGATERQEQPWWSIFSLDRLDLDHHQTQEGTARSRSTFKPCKFNHGNHKHVKFELFRLDLVRFRGGGSVDEEFANQQ